MDSQRIGSYEVLDPLGEGTVGQVFRVRLMYCAEPWRKFSAGCLVDNVYVEPWPSGRPSYPGSKLAEPRESVGERALLTMWDTGETS